MNLDLKKVTDEITALMIAYPELVDDEVLREDMIEGSTTADEFMSDTLRRIGSTDALITGTIAYAKELQDRIERLERRRNALRGLLFKVMELANLKKRELPEATISIRKGPQKVVIVEEKDIPEAFWRIKREPDKAKIKAAILGDTANVPGAYLSNGEAVLSIIVK